MRMEFIELSERHADVTIPEGGHNEAGIDLVIQKNDLWLWPTIFEVKYHSRFCRCRVFKFPGVSKLASQ